MFRKRTRPTRRCQELIIAACSGGVSSTTDGRLCRGRHLTIDAPGIWTFLTAEVWSDSAGMLLWLIRHFGLLMEQVESRTTGDSEIFLTARTATASVMAFTLTMLFGPHAIRWLKRRFRERIASDSETLNQLHAEKQNTPTMGGMFIMAAVLMTTLLCSDLTNVYVQVGLFAVTTLSLIGAWDDWTKQRTDRNGISVRQKLLAQSVVGVACGAALYSELPSDVFSTDWPWSVGNAGVALGVCFVLWSVVVIVGSANGVNLTDGLDGLATGCTVFCGLAFAGLAYVCGHSVIAEYLSIPHVEGAGELAVMLAALVGASLGFLWFNCHPAEVFMGDTGSLPTGGLLAVTALVTRQEVLLLVIGGVFVAETVSVILQVGWFRCTGRRILRCSPLHNHFVFRGDHETKIVTRFWIASAVLAIIGIASLKLR